jgi:hypothetical protein
VRTNEQVIEDSTLTGLVLPHLEIKMIMVSTSRVELLPARWASIVAPHVLQNGQLGPACTAKYCLLVPFTLWPSLDLVIGERGVAVFARIVDTAALHLDGNNVGWPVIVFATCLRVDVDAKHFWKTRNHS